MRDINLLPRKTFIERSFRPLLAAIIFLTLGTGAAILYVYGTYDSDLQSLKAEISRMESLREELTEMRRPDPAFGHYQDYRILVESLEASRRDWLPLLSDVTGLMPAASRVLSMSASQDGTLSMSMEFSRWEDIADYLIRLRASNLVDSVEIQNVSQVETEIRNETAQDAGWSDLPAATPWDWRPEDDRGVDVYVRNEALEELLEALARKAGVSRPDHSGGDSRPHGPQEQLAVPDPVTVISPEPVTVRFYQVGLELKAAAPSAEGQVSGS